MVSKATYQIGDPMSAPDPGEGDHRAAERIRVFLRSLLTATHEVADKTVDRLRKLQDHLSGDLIRQVERLRRDPNERRGAVRISDPALPVCVRWPDEVEAIVEGYAIDRSPRGLALILPKPVENGIVLQVRSAKAEAQGAWFTVEVKHCHREERGWLIGCEVSDDLAGGTEFIS